MRTSPLLGAVLAVALSGCLDSEEEFTLNPDGSGKVTIKAVSVPRLFEFGPKRSPEESLKDNVADTLKKSQGIDGWGDVRATVRDDGKTAFSGTAYFKDLSKVRLNILGVDSDFPNFELKNSDDGGLTLQAGPRRSDAVVPAPPPGPKPTEEELQELLKQERAKMQGGRRLMEGFLKDLRMTTRLVLPGAVAESKNFKKVSDRVVEVTIEGKTVIKTLDELIADDAFLRKQIESNRHFAKDGPPVDDAVMEKLFGEKGPLRVSVKGPAVAAFDYEAEAGAARKALPELLQKYGLPPPLAPAAAGEGFKSVKVIGVKMIHAADTEKGLTPFSESEPGLHFALLGQFSGSVLSLREASITKAVSDSGEDLLCEREFDRRISFPRLSNDRGSVVLEARLRLPTGKCRGIQELAGTLQYVIGKDLKEVDLGLAEFARGASGKALGASIEALEDAQFQEGHQALTLKLATEREAIQSVAFYDAEGKQLEANFPSDTPGGDATFYVTLKGKFPAKGRAVAKVYQDLKVYEIPFSVSKVDLSGRPMK